ncbi:response regulator transcription factor [Streptomyces sp. NPDC049585]|uniref:response regulator transcription factor n=1 Tax=Streptomyces sp. NPDC049585 TaxID=3155154 RepID=UPI00343DC450
MIRVVIAEHLDMVRAGLVLLLDREPDIKVVGSTATGSELIPTVLEYSPDVALIDVDAHERESLNAAVEIQEYLPDCRTLLMARFARLATVRQSLAAGLGGLVLKKSPPHSLGDAVRRVHTGQRVFDTDMTLAAWGNTAYPLTEREMEILQLAAAGDGISEIAHKLSLSAGTVRNYLTTIVRKMDARNRLDAVRIASSSGWI